MKRTLVFIVLTLTFFACKSPNPKPEKFLNEDEMEALLLDVQLLEVRLGDITGLPQDSLKIIVKANYEEVFKKYNITNKDFEENVHYYSYYPDEFEKMYSRIERKCATQDSLANLPKETK